MSADIEFQQVVDSHYAALYRFACSLSRKESEACDLTQETFYIWAENRRQIHDESKVKSWLFTTLHRLFLRKFHRASKFPETDLDSAEYELPQIEPFAGRCEDAHAVLAALGRLDPAFQAPVALFYLEDCSYPEIAVILNIPLGTVKSRIARGVAQLQKMLLSASESRKGAA